MRATSTPSSGSSVALSKARLLTHTSFAHRSLKIRQETSSSIFHRKRGRLWEDRRIRAHSVYVECSSPAEERDLGLVVLMMELIGFYYFWKVL